MISNDRSPIPHTIEPNIKVSSANTSILTSFRSGRDGLHAIINSAREWSNKTVALPSYAPEGLVLPFLRSQWEVVFYPLTPQLGIDQNQFLNNCVGRSLDLVVIVHFFGLETQFQETRDWCETNDIEVVEDFSHHLPVDFENPENVKTTEISIVSLPKLFGVSDGAWIRLSPKCPIKLHVTAPDRIYTISSSIVNRLSFAAENHSSNTLRLLTRLFGAVFSPYRRLLATFERHCGMSLSSTKNINAIEFSSVAQRRMAIWQQYLTGLNRDVLAELDYRQHRPCINFGFPIMVQDRDAVTSELAKLGIKVTTLINRWDYRGIAQSEEARQSASYILNHHVVLPMQERLTNQEVQTVVDAVNKVGIAPPISR